MVHWATFVSVSPRTCHWATRCWCWCQALARPCPGTHRFLLEALGATSRVLIVGWQATCVGRSTARLFWSRWTQIPGMTSHPNQSEQTHAQKKHCFVRDEVRWLVLLDAGGRTVLSHWLFLVCGCEQVWLVALLTCQLDNALQADADFFENRRRWLKSARIGSEYRRFWPRDSRDETVCRHCGRRDISW